MQVTWMWHWITSWPLLPTSLWQTTPADSFSTTSGGCLHSSLWRRCILWSRLLSSPPWTTATHFWLHVPPNLCSSPRMQQPSWSSTYPSSPTLHCSSALCTGYQWLLGSDSRHWYLPTMLGMAQAHPTSSTWSYTLVRPLHSAPWLMKIK